MHKAALLPLLLGLAACVPRSNQVVEPGPEPAQTGPSEEVRRAEAQCREAYFKTILIPDGHLGSPDLRSRVAAIVEAEGLCPPESLNELGAAALAFMVQDEHETALRYANLALELDPNSADAFAHRGIVQRNMDADDEAASDFERAIAIDPDHKVAHLELGLIFESRGDLVRAKQHLGHAASAHPKYVIASEFLADIFIGADDLTGAEPHCNAVLQEIHDDKMAVCRGLARASRKEHAGVVEDLSDFVGNDLSSKYESEIESALRNAYLAEGQPLLAAEYTCVETGPINSEECEDDEVADAVDQARVRARSVATGGSYPGASEMSPRAFGRAIKGQAREASDLNAFIHPEIGVFIFRPFGWELEHAQAWPVVPEALPEVTLDDLKTITRLPKRVGWETNELDCSYILDGMEQVGFDVGLSTYFAAGATPVPDIYRLGDVRDYFDENMPEAQWTSMQRAALGVTHRLVRAGELYEFGQIDGKWYLLTVVVNYDPENDACG